MYVSCYTIEERIYARFSEYKPFNHRKCIYPFENTTVKDVTDLVDALLLLPSEHKPFLHGKYL